MAKNLTAREENVRLRRAKKQQAAMSLASGGLGLGALGTLGASAALKRPQLVRHLKYVKTPEESSKKLLATSAALTTTGAGVGGAGSLNFARVQNQEANKLPKKVSKAMPRALTASAKIGRVVDSSKGPQAKQAFGARAKKKFGDFNAHRKETPEQRFNRFHNDPTKGARYERRITTTPPRRGFDKGTSERTVLADDVYRTRGKGKLWEPGETRRTRSGTVIQDASGRSNVRVGDRVSYSRDRGMPTENGILVGAAGTYGLTAGGLAVAEKREQAKKKAKRKTPVKKELGGLGMDFGLSGVTQGTSIVSKAYDPERNRKKRLDAYSTGLNAGAGAAGLGAGLQGKEAVRSFKRSSNTLAAAKAGGKGTAARHEWAFKHYKTGLKSSGKAGALGAASLGALIGADQIQRYKRGRGDTYRPRSF